jgi:dTDP-4-dehydrorhamnose 3,5-epimerase
MRIVETKLEGVLIFEAERQPDERGFFARTWERSALTSRGLDANVAETSVAFNERSGTLRGLHYQVEPHAEAKTVRCTRGAIWDVAVDLRRLSSGEGAWVGLDLSATNRRTLYVPQGYAHGYVTLEDDTEVAYQISVEHHSEAARGLRWNDPALGIEWPTTITLVSVRDQAWPLLGGISA